MADDQISIRIKADASQVKPAADAAAAGLGKVAAAAGGAQGDIAALGGAMRDYSAGATAAAQTSSAHLVPALDRTQQESDRAQSGMKTLASQIASTATQIAGGANPLVTFAEHASDMAGAITLVTGKAGGLAGFLAGPWGIAITGAIALLGTLWGKHQDASEAEKAHERASRSLEDAIEDQSLASQRNIRTNEQAARADYAAAYRQLEQEKTTRAATMAILDQIKAKITAFQITQSQGNGGLPGTVGGAAGMMEERAKQQLAAVQALADKQTEAILTAQDTLRTLGIPILQEQVRAGMDGAAGATARFNKALGELNERRRLNLEGQASYSQKYLQLLRQEERESQGSTRAGSQPRSSNAQGTAAQNSALQQRAAAQAAFLSRSTEQEAAYWEGIVKRTDLSSADIVAIEKHYAILRQSVRGSETEADVGAMGQRLAAAKGNAAAQLRIVRQIADAAAKQYGQQAKDYAAAQSRMSQTAATEAEYRQQVEDQAQKNREQRQQDDIADQESAAKFRVAMGLETDAQLLAQQRDFENMRYAIQAQALQRQMELLATDPLMNIDQFVQLAVQMEQVRRQHQQRMTQIDRQAELQRTQIVRQAIHQVSQSWGDSIGKMVTLQQGFHATAKQMWQGLQQAVGQAIGKMIADYIEQLLVSAIFATGLGATSSSAQIESSAALAGANAYASTAAIPFVGPELAPAAAATAYAGALSFQGLVVPGFDIGAWNLSRDQLAMVHSGEMIIPAHIAGPLRATLSQPGAIANLNAPFAANDGARGGDLHYHDHTGTLTPAQIVANRRAVAKALVMAHREGAFASTRLNF